MAHINLDIKLQVYQETPESIAEVKITITKDGKHSKSYQQYFETPDFQLQEMYVFPMKCFTDYIEHFEKQENLN